MQRHGSSPLSIIVATLAAVTAIVSATVATFTAIISATVIAATAIVSATIVSPVPTTSTAAASSTGPATAASTVPAAVPRIALALPILGPGRTFILVRAAKQPQDPVADAFLLHVIAGLRTLLCNDVPVRDERTGCDGKKAACRANHDAPQRYSAALHCGTNPAKTNDALSGQFDII